MRDYSTFVAAFGSGRVRLGAPLAPFTTFKVGGPADCLLEVRDSAELVRVAEIARVEGVPLTVLGGGSNVLVSDRGVRGIVVRVRGGAIVPEGDLRVRADAGATMNGLVRWMIGRGMAGLEAWAGTPGTVGGAIFGNAHYAGRLIGDLVDSVRLVGAAGELADVAASEMGFGYDVSRLQHTGELLLSALFVSSGPADPAALRETARRSLEHRKRTQPLDTPSAGCIFQNPDPAREAVPDGIPASAGALIDRAGLKGCVIGGAAVSTAHANFIVNAGGATASDIRALIERCRDTVQARFGVVLREEIRYVGEWAEGENRAMKNEE